MEEKVIKMIIYYVLAVNDVENKNIDGCIKITKLIMAMVKNEETKADRLLNSFPKEHPVLKLYNEIKEIDNEEILKLLDNCKNKFLNYNEKNIDFNKIEDDKEVEELSREIIKNRSLVMRQGTFIYDNDNNQYVAKINNIEFGIDNIPTERELSYVYTIAENYSKKLYKIADYMLQNNNFKEFFECNNMLEQELIEKLNTPSIRIINENEATISYCKHILDSTHIISFEFIGVFEKMAYLSIDG